MRDTFRSKGFYAGLLVPFAVAGLFYGAAALGKASRSNKADYLEKVPVVKRAENPASLEAIADKETVSASETVQYPEFRYESDDNFAKDSEELVFARAIYGEARGQLETNPEYVEWVANTIKTRARKKGKSIKEIVTASRPKKFKKGFVDVFRYTCFDPRDRNYNDIKNPSAAEIPAMEKCYDIATELISGEVNLPEATNYFVGGDPFKVRTKRKAMRAGIPSWAYKMDEKGNFILDKNRKRIPREPVKVVKISKNRSAYFYDFEYF